MPRTAREGRFGVGAARRVAETLPATVVLAGLLVPGLCLGAFGTFLDVPGIPGDATFAPAAGQIQAISYTWSVGQQKATRYGSAGVCSAGRAKPVLDALCVLKHVDKASPKLMLAAAQGTDFATVTISLFDLSQPSNAAFHIYELSNAIVSSVQMAFQPGDDIPTEKVCFNFSKVKNTVNSQPAAGGPIDTVTAGFDACQRNVF